MSTRLDDAEAETRRGALASLAQVRATWIAGLRAVAAQSRAPLQAVGLTLAADAVAAADVPAEAVALVEGIAVRSLDTVGAGPYAPAPLAGGARRVAPGDALPTGCDAVVPLDAVELAAGLTMALVAATPGDGVRRAGEDARRGAVLATAGAPLTAIAAAALASAGVREVTVRVPRIAIAGAEGSPAAALLHRLAAAAGAEPVAAGGAADLLVALGGAEGRSFAPSDAARGLALRPGGEEMRIGQVSGVPAVRLPDRADAAVAAWVALLRPAVAALADARPVPMSAVVGGKVASAPGFCDLVLLRHGVDDTGRLAVLSVGEAPLSRLALAVAAGLVAEDSEGLPPGGLLPVILL